MGCIPSRNVVPLTSDNMGKNGDFNNLGKDFQQPLLFRGESETNELETERRKRAADELETERHNRVAKWVTALDKVTHGEQQIVVVQATEGSEASIANSHHSDCSDVTIIDDESTPRPVQAPEDSQDSRDGSDRKDESVEHDSDEEASVGDSEPDIISSSGLKKKSDVRDLLDHLRNTLKKKRDQEKADWLAADLAAQFSKFDLNSDGVISKNEFVKICKALGTDLDSEALAQIFYTIDHNGDGMLERDEFIAAFKPRPPPKKIIKLEDPMEAIMKTKGDRPISAKLLNWKSDFG